MRLLCEVLNKTRTVTSLSTFIGSFRKETYLCDFLYLFVHKLTVLLLLKFSVQKNGMLFLSLVSHAFFDSLRSINLDLISTMSFSEAKYICSKRPAVV